VNGFQTAREELAGKLTAAGVPAVLDPRAAPPCVLVGPPTVTARQGIGGWSTTIPVRIISAPPGDDAGLGWMLDQLEVVLLTLGGGTADVGTYDVAGKDCPAYTVPVPVDVANPNC
jgi:hypothetical protein